MWDVINATFEVMGAIFVWSNVVTLRRDRCVQGVNLSVSAFYGCWGVMASFYYISLGHWASLIGNVLILSGNLAWLTMALRLRQAPGGTIGHGDRRLPTARNNVP